MRRGTPDQVAVFLDRDGTVNLEVGYLSDSRRFALYPEAGEAIRTLNRLGVRVVLVSNQSGVGRGYFPREAVEKVNAELERCLEEEGAHLDALYWCGHTPEDRCHCRKPEPGHVRRAESELGIDPTQSYVVGDRESDLELARQVGARSILVLTGYGRETFESGATADYVAHGLRDAVEWIVRDLSEGGDAEGCDGVARASFRGPEDTDRR